MSFSGLDEVTERTNESDVTSLFSLSALHPKEDNTANESSNYLTKSIANQSIASLSERNWLTNEQTALSVEQGSLTNNLLLKTPTF